MEKELDIEVEYQKGVSECCGAPVYEVGICSNCKDNAEVEEDNENENG
jgi:hypothetical protein